MIFNTFLKSLHERIKKVWISRGVKKDDTSCNISSGSEQIISTFLLPRKIELTPKNSSNVTVGIPHIILYKMHES